MVLVQNWSNQQGCIYNFCVKVILTRLELDQIRVEHPDLYLCLLFFQHTFQFVSLLIYVGLVDVLFSTPVLNSPCRT